MKRTAGSKMMMVAMACTMLFTGVAAEAAVTREAKAANGTCPYCIGYADDIYGPGIYWYEAEETYYNGNAYCKKLLCNKKGTYLISLNDKYDPIEIAEGEIFKTFGRVVS